MLSILKRILVWFLFWKRETPALPAAPDPNPSPPKPMLSTESLNLFRTLAQASDDGLAIRNAHRSTATVLIEEIAELEFQKVIKSLPDIIKDMSAKNLDKIFIYEGKSAQNHALFKDNFTSNSALNLSKYISGDALDMIAQQVDNKLQNIGIVTVKDKTYNGLIDCLKAKRSFLEKMFACLPKKEDKETVSPYRD